MNAYTRTLRSLGLDLPTPPNPAANYSPWICEKGFVFIAGQVPQIDGKAKFLGKVGDTCTLEEAQQAAQLCALNVIAHLHAACSGDLDRVERCVRVSGYVNATDDFKEQPAVLDGASNLIVRLLGERGRHSRVAVGVASLPRGVPVEVDAIFSVRL